MALGVLLFMRLSENDEAKVLMEAAKNVVKTASKLPDIACAIHERGGWARRVWCVPCHCSVPASQWEKHPKCQPHFLWQGYALGYTTQVVWRGQQGIGLIVTFHRRSAREWEGLCAAGLEGDLQEWKRRAARRQQHEKTLIIEVNRPFRLSQDVGARVQARGPTAHVPLGTSDEFKAKILTALRAHEQKRLDSWDEGRHPSHSYGHPILWVNTRTTYKEVIFYLGLYLAQAGMIDETTVLDYLVTHFHVPPDDITDVWKSLKGNFAYPQSPAGQHAYITQVTKDVVRRAERRRARTRRAEAIFEGGKREQIPEKDERAAEPAEEAKPASQQGVFSDPETEEEYWTIERTAIELNVDATTVRRWIQKKGLHTKSFLFRRPSGVQKTVTTVLRRDVECVKAHVECKKGLIGLFMGARQIAKASAQRESTRWLQRLQKHLGREPTSEDIIQELHDDLKSVAYHQRQRA